jgi:hypothetical protein
MGLGGLPVKESTSPKTKDFNSFRFQKSTMFKVIFLNFIFRINSNDKPRAIEIQNIGTYAGLAKKLYPPKTLVS